MANRRKAAFSTYTPVEGQANGKFLEAEFIDAMVLACEDEGVVQSCLGTELDRTQGTDCFIYKVPCDVTLNYEGKNNMRRLHMTYPLNENWTLKFGIRFGNNHDGFTQFLKPVLVIGVCRNNERVRFDIDELRSAFFQNAKTICTGCRDLYRYWKTQMSEPFEYL